MYNLGFKTGDMAFEILSPVKLFPKEPYSLFLCDEGGYDFRAEVRFTDEIPENRGSFLAPAAYFDAYEDGEDFAFYYRVPGENECYACRRMKKNDFSYQEIFFPEKYRETLHTRAVFSVLGFDDIAASLGAAVFHSSFISHNGAAVLFTAPSGSGKSTQAQLWRKYENADIINGDKTLIYERDGRFFASGIPFCGSSRISKNETLPIKAIVYLRKALQNSVTRLEGALAYGAVYEGCCRSLWSAENTEKISLLAEKAAESIPVFRLDCLPDESAVAALKKELEKL